MRDEGLPLRHFVTPPHKMGRIKTEGSQPGDELIFKSSNFQIKTKASQN